MSILVNHNSMKSNEGTDQGGAGRGGIDMDAFENGTKFGDLCACSGSRAMGQFLPPSDAYGVLQVPTKHQI